MSNQYASSIAVIGLSKSATENLACLFRLSDHYRLADIWSVDEHDAILVNIDDPAAVQLWQAYKANNPDVLTIIVAKHPGKYHFHPYLAARFLERPFSAKQVLSFFARVCPPHIPAEQLSLANKVANMMLSIQNAFYKKLQILSEALFKSDDHLHNSYYK